MRNPASVELIKSIKNFIESFSLNTSNPQEDAKTVQEFYKNAENSIRSHKLWADQDVDSAMEGLEKYVMTKLFSQTFSSPEDAKIDREISQKMRLLLTFLKPEHLDISEVLWNEASLYHAIKELQRIKAFKAPRSKLLCVMNSCKVIYNLLLSSASKSQAPVILGADEFLPVLIYVVIMANPPQLHSNLKFIELYRREAKLVSEAACCLTHLVSAKTFISELDAKSLSIDEAEFEESMEAARLNDICVHTPLLSGKTCSRCKKPQNSKFFLKELATLV
ncbi:PREDICTED: vacuolar protein sorting-associated protein 9A-like [Fragaria vesca subsp. vesca]